MEKQYDIEFMQTIESVSGSPTGLSLSMAETETRAVTGVQKMLQRYMLHMLTTLGSSRYDKEFGTDFLRSVQAGASQNKGRLYAVFNYANFITLRNLRREDAEEGRFGPARPEDRIRSAILEDLTVDPSSAVVQFKILVTSEAGEQYKYDFPVSVIN